MIEGPNGAGKSSLLRTIGGLWPLCGGKLTKPAGTKVLCYVPQVPYFFHGPLCDQVTYPDEPLSLDSSPELVAKFDALVAAVGLSHIVAREGGWGATKEWPDMLSGGEKQRLAFARLLYHRPRYAFLDEATAAISTEIEEGLMQACHDAGITMISVAHRKTLRAFHAQALVLEGDDKGSWHLDDLGPSTLNGAGATPTPAATATTTSSNE